MESPKRPNHENVHQEWQIYGIICDTLPEKVARAASIATCSIKFIVIVVVSQASLQIEC